MDHTYIDYKKLRILTKMKKNQKYNIIEDCMYQTTEGLIEIRIQNVTFSKVLKDGTILIHHARIITHVDIKSTNWFHYLQTIWNQIQTKL